MERSAALQHDVANGCFPPFSALKLSCDMALVPRDSGVRFLAGDMPEANDLIVGIIALVA